MSSPIDSLEERLWEACAKQRRAQNKETVDRWQADDYSYLREGFLVMPMPPEFNELVQNALVQWQQIETKVCSCLGMSRENVLNNFEKAREQFLNRQPEWRKNISAIQYKIYGAVRNMDWVNLFSWVLPNANKNQSDDLRAVGRMVTAIFYIELLAKYGNDYENTNLKKIEARWRLCNRSLAEEIADLARDKLVKYLDKTGRLLYSSADTIDKGDIYFMGLNPAGVSSDPKFFLRYDLDRLPAKTDNAYIDEIWARGNRQYEKGKYPLQERTTWLLNELTGNNAKSVCATNLVFLATESGTDVEKEWIDKCWIVHERLIAIVKPKLIISCGTSYNTPYFYLKNTICKNKNINEEIINSGHGSWKCRAFKANIAENPIQVIGLPHLSRFKIIDKTDIVNWIKNKMRT